MSEQNYPTVDELCIQLLTDKHLYENAERLIKLCSELKIKTKLAARNSYTFTYKNKSVFNFLLRSTPSYKGFEKADHSNSLHVSLSIGYKNTNPEKFLSSLPDDMQIEYLSSPKKHCGCSRAENCFVEYEKNNKKYPLCTMGFGYSRLNPTLEQFDLIERFIRLRVKYIDEHKT